MTMLAEARNLSIDFGPLRAVSDVSIAIAAGETVGLVGESGSGKTTLGKALIGLYPPATGEVALAGRSLDRAARRDRLWRGRTAQLMFQDPLSSLSPRLTLRSLLAEPGRIHGLETKAYWARVKHLLAAMAIPESLLGKYPHQVSGGQVRRVAIARALALEPRFVVADEPTAGLDVSVQGDLLNLLAELQSRLGLTYLVVSHNLNVVRKITGRVAVMYLGEIVEEGPTRALFARPAHPYTAALLSANPQVDPGRRREKIVLEGEIPSPLKPPSGCRFHTRCPKAEARCRAEHPEATDLGEGRRVRCHFPLA
ncbi:MAG: ABC transporter ATP-binding protein [Alphaproteobacteria bacterium]|nr:ABC transporter ATP-binding protein [Alphaproteobacteria bacterium]